MKKSIRNILICAVIILALAMALSFSACGSNKDHAETKSLYAQGLEVVQLMAEMTNTEAYIDIHTGDSAIKDIIQSISNGDYSAAEEGVELNGVNISITDENLTAMAELGNLDNASEELKSVLMQRVLGSLIPQINGMSGVENLAASSVCTVGKTFVDENATENAIYLYTYENATPVAVTFTVGEDQAVSASGVFVMYDGFTCGSADEIKSFFSDITVEVKEVLPER